MVSVEEDERESLDWCKSKSIRWKFGEGRVRDVTRSNEGKNK